MNILHLVRSISPAYGGPTEAIRLLVEHAPAGYTAEIVTLDDPAQPFLQPTQNQMPCPVHALGSGDHPWYAAALLPWLKANRHRFDGALVHGLWQYTGVAAWLAFGNSLPYMVFAHGMLDPYFKRAYPLKHAKKWLFWLGAEYWMLRKAARVLFTTSAERDLAAESFFLHHWRPLVAPLGSIPPPAGPQSLIEAFETQMPTLRNRRFLLFLGRIDQKKGCDLLLRAFAALAPNEPDLHLVMAGPDPADWGADLQKMAAAVGVGDRVHWPGMLRGEAKWGAFSACEAFILPSHQENFGIAAVEALASGKPVLLAQPVNLAPDLERAGCAIMEPDTQVGTDRLIARWLALSHAARHAMGDRALAVFESQYDMRRNTETILRVFEDLTPVKRTAPKPLRMEAV